MFLSIDHKLFFKYFISSNMYKCLHADAGGGPDALDCAVDDDVVAHCLG